MGIKNKIEGKRKERKRTKGRKMRKRRNGNEEVKEKMNNEKKRGCKRGMTWLIPYYRILAS